VAQKRKTDRVHFELGLPATIMGIDGTWSRQCLVEDISATGAQLSFEGSIEGLPSKEFFLVLATRGGAYRVCERVWLKGETIGVRFLTKGFGDPAQRRNRARNAILRTDSGGDRSEPESGSVAGSDSD
jgi:PilZ domain-containing protein